MTENPTITEEQYDQLLAENRNHGRVLFNDLLVLGVHGIEIPVVPPRVLPAAVRRNPFASKVRFITEQTKEERIEGIEGILHGQPVWYEKSYFEAGNRLRAVLRHEGPLQTNHDKAGSHYHISELSHMSIGFDKGLGRPIIGFGDQIRTFDEAFDILNHELLLYLGVIKEDFKPNAYTGKRPPTDLGISMLHAYTMGFRESTVLQGKQEILERVDQFLDRLPY